MDGESVKDVKVVFKGVAVYLILCFPREVFFFWLLFVFANISKYKHICILFYFYYFAFFSFLHKR